MYAIFALLVFYLMMSRRIFYKMSEIRGRTEKAQKERAEVEYKLLRDQVNPHFLFNCLSTLSSLTQTDGEQSELFIARLAKAYRYMLEQREAPTAPLSSEWDFLESLKYILEVRYGNKLRIEAPQPTVSGCRIVPMTTQVLIEHAIKHNRMSTREPLVVRLQIEDGCLVARTSMQRRVEPNRAIESSLDQLHRHYIDLIGRPLLRREENDVCTIWVPLLDSENKYCASAFVSRHSSLAKRHSGNII